MGIDYMMLAAELRIQRDTLAAALRNLVAAAEPIDAKDWISRNEWDELSVALTAAKEVLK